MSTAFNFQRSRPYTFSGHLGKRIKEIEHTDDALVSPRITDDHLYLSPAHLLTSEVGLEEALFHYWGSALQVAYYENFKFHVDHRERPYEGTLLIAPVAVRLAPYRHIPEFEVLYQRALALAQEMILGPTDEREIDMVIKTRNEIEPKLTKLSAPAKTKVIRRSDIGSQEDLVVANTDLSQLWVRTRQACEVMQALEMYLRGIKKIPAEDGEISQRFQSYVSELDETYRSAANFFEVLRGTGECNQVYEALERNHRDFHAKYDPIPKAANVPQLVPFNT